MDLNLARFAVREARLADAAAIARVHVASWNAAYRGILPEHVLDRYDVGHRLDTRRQILQQPETLHLVAHDTTFGELVGFSDAGRARRPGPWHGEVYAIYLLHHARHHGLGRELFDHTMTWMRGRGMRSMIVWVLENNPHARAFYEALGGRASARIGSTIAGHAVVEVGYVWDPL